MTVSFDYTKEDLTAFQIYYRESTGHKWFQPLLVLYPAVTIFLIIILIYLGREHFTGGIFILSCMSLMWLVIFIVFQFDNKRRMKKHWNKVLSSPKNASLFGHLRYILDDTGINYAVPYEEGRTEWAGIVGYGETDEHIFIHKASVAAFVFPKRALNNSEVEELRSLLKKHVPAGQGQKQN